MEENLKVDDEYKEAFNLGYDLAKELNLKSPMFNDVNLDNGRMSVIQSGMAQYLNEISHRQVNKSVQSLGLDKNLEVRPKRDKDNDNGKGSGLNQSL